MNQIENIMQLADLYSVLFGRYRIELSALSLSEHQKARMALRDAIEQALAVQPKQEPVAWTWDTKSQHDGFLDAHFQFSKPDEHPNILNLQALYTAPQPHTKPEK